MTSLGLHEYGVRVNLESSHLTTAQLRSVLLPHWQPRAPEPDAPTLRFDQADGGWALAFEGETLTRQPDLEKILTTASSRLHQYFAEKSLDPIFVHAGVVVWQGRALLFPGASYSGKSTLVHALVSAGAGYFSDEYALVDARSGKVRPFPRSLSLRDPERHLALPPPPAQQLTEGVTVAAVWDLKYTTEGTGSLAEVSRGQGVLSLLRNTVLARSLGETLLPAFHRVIAGAQCWSGSRREAGLAAEAILRG